MNEYKLSRRQALAATAGIFAAGCMHSTSEPTSKPVQSVGSKPSPATTASRAALPPWDGPIVDIHQHAHYAGRSDEALLHHQKRMGVTETILLPSASAVDSPATMHGKANGLYAGAGGIELVLPIVEAHPKEYCFFSNEAPDIPTCRTTIEKYLKMGAKGIGEQKFYLPCDSQEMQNIYAIAQDYNVPITMHFQYEAFNMGYERFGKMLEKWNKVTFIGHAMLFWANIDANADQKVNYPKGKVKPGGLTDRYLSDYPNLYADMSAGSGLNAMARDTDHYRGFIERHQDRMMFGSDCNDAAGVPGPCAGASIIANARRLSPNREVANKLLYLNAKKLFKF